MRVDRREEEEEWERERAEDGEVESGIIGRRSPDGIFFFRGRRRGEIERDL